MAYQPIRARSDKFMGEIYGSIDPQVPSQGSRCSPGERTGECEERNR